MCRAVGRRLNIKTAIIFLQKTHRLREKACVFYRKKGNLSYSNPRDITRRERSFSEVQETCRGKLVEKRRQKSRNAENSQNNGERNKRCFVVVYKFTHFQFLLYFSTSLYNILYKNAIKIWLQITTHL